MSLSLEREAAIHMQLRHASIVSMIGVVLDLDNQGFVLEYVKYGSYTSFIQRFTMKNGLQSQFL